VIGCITCVFAATIALVQTDIKKVLAVLDGQPAWLHVPGDVASARFRRASSTDDTCFLQGAVVPGSGQRDHGDASRAGHASDGRVRKKIP